MYKHITQYTHAGHNTVPVEPDTIYGLPIDTVTDIRKPVPVM